MPRSTGQAAIKNRLLDALPRRDRDRLLASADQVELKLSNVLCEAEERIRHVFFPTGSFISLISPIDAAASLEVGLVGDEGMLGTSLVLGVNSAPQRALVQGSGTAWRLTALSFSRELERSVALQQLLKRYLYVTMCQVAQTAVCTHYHDVEARLARWLLMSGDRAHCDQFFITQQFMSYMLGVRREGVTAAAGVLKKRKLIRYRRGEITILNRRGLQNAACVCYGTAKETYRRVLS
ncbi:MAG TPA: Crp/Fnr family transcriptional regulator [Steroidobacteraceae bacterium]|nr:Crp/Fnr family transcriptional regulator [Steroidobacteraceae bacterium]